MRFLFVHQNFPGQFRHVSAALAARGDEVVALGINKPREPIPGVRHVLYRPRPAAAAELKHLLDGPLAELQDKWHRGEAAARAMEALRKARFVPDVGGPFRVG